jgi:hypothetical protein
LSHNQPAREWEKGTRGKSMQKKGTRKMPIGQTKLTSVIEDLLSNFSLKKSENSNLCKFFGSLNLLLNGNGYFVSLELRVFDLKMVF